ncbi:MAG TPA: choice-of-anchor X domain-containing protein [Bryobacteraceae bacterium]
MKRRFLVAAMFSAISGLAIAQITRDAKLPADFTEAVILTPQAAQVERTFIVETANTMNISVRINSLTAQVTLIDPAGVNYTAGSVLGAETASSKYVDPSGKNQSHEFEFTNPAAGQWKYRVVEPASFSGVRAAIFLKSSTNDIIVGILGGGRDYPVGRSISLGLAITNQQGGILRSSITSLTASVRTGNLPAQPITFADDGALNDDKANDGIYSATFTVNTAGTYVVSVIVSGAANGQVFSRTAVANFNAIAPCASLARAFTSRVRDTNSNGRSDVLEVSFTVNVAKAGTLNLAATLTAANNQKQTISDFALFPTLGTQIFNLDFPLTHLRALGTNGPYQVSDVYLSCMSGTEIQQTDQQFDLGPTVSFDLTAADRRGIEPSGQNSDRAVDTNGNGLFDRLEFSLGLDLLTSGGHQWSGTLYDKNGHEIDFFAGSGTLPSGKTSALFAFSGPNIGKNAVDGPYFVRNILISGPNSASVLLIGGSTQPYNYDKFEQAFPRAPTISQGGVVNAASFAAPVARGGLASLFGAGLSPVLDAASRLPLPRNLDDLRVTVNGVDAPLLYISPTQVNFQVPFETPARGGIPVVVNRAGSASSTFSITVADNAPGIFTYQRTATVRDPVIAHADATLVTPDRPAAPDEVVILYATGVGALNNAPATGEGAPLSPLASAITPPVVMVGGTQAQVLFAGLTPFFVGLVQVNFRVPSTLPATGSTVPLSLSFGQAAANNVNLSIPPAVDLSVKLDSVSPASVGAGDPITVNYSVTEPGKASGTFTRKLYISTTASITAQSTLVSTRTFDLASGNASITSTGNSIPRELAAGKYFVAVVVEAPRDVNTANNTSQFLPITVTNTRVPFDLGVSLLSVSPASIAAGGSATVSYRIHNYTGSTGIYNRSIYISRSSNVTANDTLINTRTVALTGDDTDVESTDNIVPANLTPGAYFIAVILESVGDVDPTDNRSGSLPVTITARAASTVITRGTVKADVERDFPTDSRLK